MKTADAFPEYQVFDELPERSSDRIPLANLEIVSRMLLVAALTGAMSYVAIRTFQESLHGQMVSYPHASPKQAPAPTIIGVSQDVPDDHFQERYRELEGLSRTISAHVQSLLKIDPLILKEIDASDRFAEVQLSSRALQDSLGQLRERLDVALNPSEREELQRSFLQTAQHTQTLITQLDSLDDLVRDEREVLHRNAELQKVYDRNLETESSYAVILALLSALMAALTQIVMLYANSTIDEFPEES